MNKDIQFELLQIEGHYFMVQHTMIVRLQLFVVLGQSIYIDDFELEIV